MELDSESDSDCSGGGGGGEYRGGRRLSRHVFEPYFKKIFCSSGFVKHMNQRCTGSNDSTSYILLCAAIQRGDTRSATCLLKHYCKGNMGRPDPSKDLPLQLAVLAGNLELVDMLLSKGARASVSFQDQREPLHLICDRQSSPLPSEPTRLAIARLLLQHGASPNAAERQNRDSPLILAVRSKLLEVARLLLAQPGCDRHQANRHAETALQVAFSENAGIDMIELLYDGAAAAASAAELRRLDKERLSPLSHAVRNLMNSGFGSPLSFSEPLRPVRFLLEHGVSVDSRLDKRANRILHMICQNHAAHTLPLFLERGAEVDARNEDGKTPLHFAAEHQAPQLVELLLQRGADPGSLTEARQSVLHFAAANKNCGVLELLLRRCCCCCGGGGGGGSGLDVDAKAKDGNFTPLFNAVWANRPENARTLLQWGARVNERIINNQVVLHVAVDQKHVDLVRLLLEHGADVNALDDYGNSPLGISLYQISDSRQSDWSDDDEDDAAAAEELLRPAEAVQKILTRHAARLLSSSPEALSEQSLRVLRSPHFRDYLRDCLAELERLGRSCLLADDSLSLARVLAAPRRRLVGYLRNERFLEDFRAADCRRAFPIYGGALEQAVEAALERLALLERSAASLDRLLQGLGESWIDVCLPCLVVEHILGYLRTADLHNLALLDER